MAENIDESVMRKFVHRVFKKSDDIGNLTVKSVRQQFLEQLGLEKLDPEQKEVFKTIVHNIYSRYSSKHREKNGHQESNVEDSQTTTETDDVSDSTVSSSSVSSRRKKRKHEINSDDNTCMGEISDPTGKSEKEEQKKMTVSEKEMLQEMGKEGVQKKKNSVSKTKPLQKINGKAEPNDSNSEGEGEIPNSASSRSQKINSDTDSDVHNSKDKTPRKKNVSKKKRKQKIDEDTDSSGSNSEVESSKKVIASSNKITSHEIDDEESTNSNSNEEEEDTRKKIAAKKKQSGEIGEHVISSDNNSEDQMNEEQKQRVGRIKSNQENSDADVDDKQKKKHKKRPKDTSSAERKKKSSPPSENSIRLKNLKRFVRTCGLHKNYVKLFADCDSMSQKEKSLERVLRKDTGFEGRITLAMCKKFKQAKEEADELAELDCKNIITADDGRRSTRRTRAGSDNQPTPAPNSDGHRLFSRLKGVVDSDGSDSEEEKQGGKRALNTSLEKWDSQENSRKKRRLDSSSDEDDD